MLDESPIEAGSTQNPGEGSTPPATPVADGAEGTQNTVQTDPKDGAPAAKVIPDKYEFKVPEGMVLNEALAAKFEPLAKEYGLDNANAQKLVDLYAEVQANELAAVNDKWSKTLAEWDQTIKQDKEIGGHNLAEATKHAQAAFAQFGTPELMAFLNESQLGSHPEVVRWAARIGKAAGEGKVIGSEPSNPARSAKDFYSNSNMN